MKLADLDEIYVPSWELGWSVNGKAQKPHFLSPWTLGLLFGVGPFSGQTQVWTFVWPSEVILIEFIVMHLNSPEMSSKSHTPSRLPDSAQDELRKGSFGVNHTKNTRA